MAHTIITVDIFDYVVFGATGDLSKKKLYPALYQRFADGQIPSGARIIGCARTILDASGFKDIIEFSIRKNIKDEFLNEDKLQSFLSCLLYLSINFHSDEDWKALRDIICRKKDDRVRVFYLSINPSLIEPVVYGLKKHNLNIDSRVVIEKPLGVDLPSSIHLNKLVRDVFDEKDIYRIDHYLGKETVQNLMALRFANSMFEPLWNSHYIDHVQITVAESIGVAGRGGYYDDSGALRDMIQNHLLQLLCLCAMEPPASFIPDSVRDEKLKVLQCLKPLNELLIEKNTIVAQYTESECYSSYLKDIESSASNRESYTALKINVDNWRWKNTPFYLRTGKRLPAQMAEVAVVFRDTPHFIFGEKESSYSPNAIIIQLQPEEGIDIQIITKEPGHGGMRLRKTILETSQKDQDMYISDAYQRLLLDVVRGDQTLFMRGDEVEAAWSWIDPIIQYWEENQDPIRTYPAGSDGPQEAVELMNRKGRKWRKIQ